MGDINTELFAKIDELPRAPVITDPGVVTNLAIWIGHDDRCCAAEGVTSERPVQLALARGRELYHRLADNNNCAHSYCAREASWLTMARALRSISAQFC